MLLLYWSKLAQALLVSSPLPPFLYSLYSFHSTLASLFKQSGPRSPGLQSSFPTNTLQPVGPKDINGILHRRSSRTDLDFEQALRAGGTVQLKEGPDVDALGADISFSSISSLSPPTPSPTAHNRHTFHHQQPATPTIIPATPSPTARNSPINLQTRPPSQASSTDIYYDAEDSDFQTKRRSMYRSPGTASSPDLATLLKKAKERSSSANKDTRKRPPSNTPTKASTIDTSDVRGRERTSASAGLGLATSSNPSSPLTAAHYKGKGRPGRTTSENRDLNASGASSPSPDWIFTSPRSLSSMIENGGKVRVNFVTLNSIMHRSSISSLQSPL